MRNDSTPVAESPLTSGGADDEARFEVLRSALQRAVRRACPTWPADRRDDLVQIAVVKVMQSAKKSEGNEGYPTSYLYKVATSVVIDEIRRRKRKPEVSLEDGGSTYEPHARYPDPERLARSQELGRGVRDCLQAMRRERRLAVTLYLVGHTVQEASDILGWDFKRTENLVYRGLADLRQCLLGKGLKS